MINNLFLNLVCINNNDEYYILKKIYDTFYNITSIYYIIIDNTDLSIQPVIDKVNNDILYLSDKNLLLSKIENKHKYNYIIKSDINNIINFNNITDIFNINNDIYYIKNNNISYLDYNNLIEKSNIIIIINLYEEDLLLDNDLFNNILNKLKNQILKPKLIIYNIINPTNFNLNKLELIDTNIIINYGNNLLSLNNIIKQSDKLIFINNKFDPNLNMTLMYELCYQLYECDAICVNINNNLNYIFYDNTNNSNNVIFNLNKSYSYRFESLYKLELYSCSINIELGNIELVSNNNTSKMYLDIKNQKSTFTIKYTNPIIKNNIPIRNLLYNVNNNNYNDNNKYINIKYYNDTTVILIITYYNNIPNYDLINIEVNDYKYNILIFNEDLNKKIVLFIPTYKINKILHNNYNFNLIQSYKNNIMNLNDYYCIINNLILIPDINYIFYNEPEMEDLLKTNNLIYKLYNKINLDYYKNYLFKYWYIYNYGGLYIDINNILKININILLNEELIITNFLLSKNTNNAKVFIKNNLINICNNIYQNNYINLNNIYTIQENETYNINDYVLIYNINENIELDFLYNIINIDYKKLIGIDYIIWINLDRSFDRRLYMENLLSKINIPNIRIPAIDGKLSDYTKADISIDINNYEICCTLSHLLSINYLNNLSGNYFLVCEDDISLENLFLFDKTIKDIINESPEFDILMIYKTFYEELELLYTPWKPQNGVGGTAAYIITRKGIEKIIKNVAVYDFNFNNFYFKQKIGVSDYTIYSNVNTLIYKYNYIGTLNKTSTIHPDHLHMHQCFSNIQTNILIKDLL